MSSKITKLEVRYFERDNLRAFADVEVNNDLSLYGIRVIEGKKGLFVSWPSRKTKRGDEDVYMSIFRPVNDTEFATELQDAVLAAYHDGKKSGDRDGID